MLKIQYWAGIHETKLNNHGEQNVCLEFHRLLGVDLVGTAVYGVESLEKEREDEEEICVYSEISPRKWNCLRAIERVESRICESSI